MPLCRRFVSNHQLLNSCLQLRLESIQSQSNIESVNITTVSLSGSHYSYYTCTMNSTVIVNDHISTARVLCCTKVLPQSTLPPPSRQGATTETAKLPMHHPSLESYTICHRHHLQYTPSPSPMKHPSLELLHHRHYHQCLPKTHYLVCTTATFAYRIVLQKWRKARKKCLG